MQVLMNLAFADLKPLVQKVLHYGTDSGVRPANLTGKSHYDPQGIYGEVDCRSARVKHTRPGDS